MISGIYVWIFNSNFIFEEIQYESLVCNFVLMLYDIFGKKYIVYLVLKNKEKRDGALKKEKGVRSGVSDQRSQL